MSAFTLVQLAHSWDKKKPLVGMFASEKLDGMRAIWLPATVGKHYTICGVPASVSNKKAGIATGLWSRGGNIINAPASWTAHLPACSLDGELYMADCRENILSVVRRSVNTLPWGDIRFHAFDAPGPQPFILRLRNIIATDIVVPVTQFRLSADWRLEVDAMFAAVMERGGEGLMFKSPGNTYHASRSKEVLKYKPLDDEEGTVIGSRAAEFGITGKIAGLMGTLQLQSQRGTFEISGFTDAERAVSNGEWCLANPGQLGAEPVLFPVGTVVTFKYHGLNKSGIPNNARYQRERIDL